MLRERPTSSDAVRPPTVARGWTVDAPSGRGAATASLSHLTVVAGQGPPLHVRDVTTTYLVTSGVLALQVDDEIHDLEPGASATVPAGSPQSYDVIVGSADVVVLMVPPTDEHVSVVTPPPDPTRTSAALGAGSAVVGPPLRTLLALE